MSKRQFKLKNIIIQFNSKVRARVANLKNRYEQKQKQITEQIIPTYERLSIKRSILVFLELWGLGSRNIFYTIGHLFSRPGYMISDYLNGKRNCYLQPFKTFVVLTLLFIQVAWLFDIEIPQREAITPIFTTAFENAQKLDQEKLSRILTITQSIDNINHWRDTHLAYGNLFGSIIVSLLTWLLWRKCPRVGSQEWEKATGEQIVGYNFAEILTVIVYILCQMQVLTIFYIIFLRTLPTNMVLFNLILFIVLLIDFKQLFQRGWWATIWRTCLILIFI